MKSPYPGIRIKKNGGVATVQPLEDSEEHVPTLKIDLVKGDIQLTKEKVLKTNVMVSPGLLGLIKLKETCALVVVKEVQQATVLNGHAVFKVLETDVIHPDEKSQHSTDAEYLSLVQSGTNPKDFGRGLHFSYTKHLTLSSERETDISKDLTSREKQWWELEDSRFFWNKYLSAPLADCGAHRFVLPMIQGFVGEVQEVVFSKGSQWAMASLFLIARRSVQRIGTRHWRRGADKEGFAANFVETEQIVNVDKGKHYASFVTIRGSIPLFWTQIPCIKFKPPTKVATKDVFGAAFDRHINHLTSVYKDVVGISLVNSHGSEGMLSNAFIEESNRFQGRAFKLVPFDFHKECGTRNYHRISVLWKKIESDFKRFGYFKMESGNVIKRQVGVFRVNCIDCLDRTNVVQGILGRKSLEFFLQDMGLLSPGATFEHSFPAVEQHFKILWADHGDEVSLQYAGSGALKSGFTRTGKRTIGGLIDDGIKTAVRYYLNNFQDGRKQDALDLITGGHKIDDSHSPFQQQLSPSLPFAIALILLMVATIKGAEALTGNPAAFKIAATTFALSATILYSLSRLGPKLVNKPCLRPEQTKQW